ncbi:MAG: hypothetical protein H6Q60_616 [Oscillospiraceae bacterium]|nr:hypothetical protein [Oscillospiraceae bacterium]
MNVWIYDAVIIAVLAVFILSGMRRGLILSLCGLLAVIVAFIGANFISTLLTPTVADSISPMVQTAVEQQLGDIPLDSVITEDSLNDMESSFLVKLILQADQTLNLFDQAKEMLVSQFAQQVADTIATWIAHITLFIVSFFLLLVVWTLVSRALNLVAKLPGLHFFNKLLGGVFGGLKGVVLLFAVAWVLRYLWNVIPEDAIENAPLLHLLMTVDPLSLASSFSLPTQTS